ncbi:MAG: LVIVD repeat-containing protein, partial [Promethearchaeota archaeon]
MTERIARKPMKKILACAIFITIWILFQQSPIHSVEAYSSLSFTEDFTTDLYRHPIYSNVTGWEEETGTISISNTIEIVGSRDTPDWALGVHVVADLAYVADDESGLQIINVSDPVAPFIVGAKNTYGWAWDVFVDNKYAYVADNHYTSNGALLIMNVTNPSVTPTVISYVNITGVLGVYVEGDYAYLAQSSGIRVVDVSDPTNPSLVGSCNIPLSPAREIVVEGDYAYAAGDFQDIQVINITNPKDPGVNGSTGGVIGYSAEAVAIDGDFAYLGAGNYVYAIDISDPTDPKVAEESPSLGGSVMGIAIDGDYLYCVCDGKGVGFNGLKVLDISDPTDTSEIASIETLGKANDVFIDGNYAYVAASNYGLQIIKISDTIDPSSVGVLSSPEYAQGVTVKGNYAFLADGSAGLKVIDISDPTNPTSKGTQDTVYAQAVAVAGDYAYIADGGGGLEIIDISDPTAPSSEATYSTIDYATDVEIVGNYAFVADREGGLQIVNITHPSLPTNISAIKVGVDSFTWGVFIRGNYAYLATSVDGSGAGAPPPYHIGSLNVVNITDITNPQYVNHTTQELVGYPVVDQVFDVWVEGNYAYLAWGGRGLRVIDITDPLSSLTEVSYINTSIARARDLFVSRNWLFLVDETGLQVTNISDPFNPEITYNYTTVGSAYDVFVKGEHAFIADQDQGLRVLKVKQSKTSQYKPFAIAQSRAFFISSYPSHVANATLTAIDNTPEGTFIEYYLSRVNGTEFFEPFYQVTSGIEFTFPENPQIAGFD